MDRTIRILINPTVEQSNILLDTIKQFTASFNIVCKVGWDRKEGNAYKLHYLTYRDCKKVYPNLVSDLHIQARQKASEVIKSAIKLLKKGKKVTCPQSITCPPRFDRHTFKINWDNRVINFATTFGRIKIPFNLPEYYTYAINHKVATAELITKNSRFFLHVVIKIPDIPFVSNDKAIGVDLGVTRPAVSSDNRFHGDRHMKEVVKKIFRLRRDLQSNGSKSAKRHLRSLAGREQRFRRDCDHVISSSILKGIESGTTIVVENLTNIRKQVKARRGEPKRRLHSWSFAQLKDFLEYKAEAIGCRVIAVDPRQTSQRCNKCGFIYRGNRKSQSEFFCRNCGYHLNADLQASRNIRDKYLVGWGISPSNASSSTGVSSHSLLSRDKSLISGS